MILAGGTEIVSAGGTDDGAVIIGGTQYDYGVASGVTVFAGSQVVEAGGALSGDTIGSGGVLILDPGGAVVSAVIQSGGSLEPFGNATPAGVTLDAGATLVVGSGDVLSNYTMPIGTDVTVLSAGTAIDVTVIGAPGFLNVSAGSQCFLRWRGLEYEC